MSHPASPLLLNNCIYYRNLTQLIKNHFSYFLFLFPPFKNIQETTENNLIN